jgi:methyltransferase (TIGR00027 family)
LTDNMLTVANLDNVESTMLLTLYCRSRESRSSNPILSDPAAIEITRRLDPVLAASQVRLYRELAAGKVNPKMSVYLSMRARRFDRYATNFLQETPAGTIVEMGCGLSTRFWRTDNGQVTFYDLDLPEVIGLKRKLVQETGRYRTISSSVLEFGWMEEVSKHKGPFLFLAEGLLMYLPPEGVKALVLELRDRFPGSDLVCEVVKQSVASGGLQWAGKLRMRKQAHLGAGAVFRFGINNSADMEGWGPGIKLLDDWTFYDDNEKKLGWIQLYGKIPAMRRIQWTTHYRLG